MEAPRWEVDGRDWPNRSASRFVAAAGLDWHVQVMGQGPAVLLLHGTGAATHSWRRLLPLLAQRYTVVAPDLPGHGFTGLPAAERMSLPGVAASVTSLLRAMDVRPALVVGHSAGAAIAAQMVLDRRIAPAGLLSLNGALRPFEGAGGFLFPVAARLLTAAPVVPWLFSLQASGRGMADRLLAGTGSRMDPQDSRMYARLFALPRHVAGALRMMSRWDLRRLDLSRLSLPVTLAVGANDRMVPPADARLLAARMPNAQVVTLPRLGHLMHEEAPDRVAALVDALAAATLPAARAVA